MTVQTNSWKMRLGQTLLLLAAMTLLMGAGDNDARFKDLGHRMMCTCGCGQILLECNHVGCQSSDRMRGELMAALGMTNGGDGGTPSGGAKTGDNDDLIL